MKTWQNDVYVRLAFVPPTKWYTWFRFKVYRDRDEEVAMEDPYVTRVFYGFIGPLQVIVYW